MISPCVAFNNHKGSTKSYDYIRDHSESVTVSDYFQPSDEITVDYEPGTSEDVKHAGRLTLRLHKLDEDLRCPRSGQRFALRAEPP